MPRTLFALPTETHSSWLDVFPPSPGSSPPPKRTPHATPQMLSRIHALKDSLSIIRLSLNTRIHMSLSHKHHGFYCVHCTPRATHGACGPTCPLLRPQKSYGPFFDVADEDWAAPSAPNTSSVAAIHPITLILMAPRHKVRITYAMFTTTWEISYFISAESIFNSTVLYLYE